MVGGVGGVGGDFSQTACVQSAVARSFLHTLFLAEYCHCLVSVILTSHLSAKTTLGRTKSDMLPTVLAAVTYAVFFFC